MPYSYPNTIPAVAKNWTAEEQKKCIGAANAVLKSGGSEASAIFACIHAAGKSKQDAIFEANFSLLNMRKQKKGRKRAIKPPPPVNLRPFQLSYLKELREMVKYLHKLMAELVYSRLASMLHQAGTARPDHMDDYVDDIKEMTSNLRNAFYKTYGDEKRANIIFGAAAKAEAGNRKYFTKLNEKMIGVDIARAEPWMKQEMKGFVTQNMNLVKEMTDNAIARTEKLVLQGAQQGWRHEELAKELMDKESIDDNKAKLIARDQISKFNAALTENRMREAGIGKYEWSTAGDERVRDTHKANEGKIFSWDDPPAETGHPGEDINCRCVAIPVLTEESTGVEEQ